MEALLSKNLTLGKDRREEMLRAQKRPGFRLTKACHMFFGVTNNTMNVQDIHDDHYRFQQCILIDQPLLQDSWEANADMRTYSSHKNRRHQISKTEEDKAYNHHLTIVIDKIPTTTIATTV
jgi:hypothetical protein